MKFYPGFDLKVDLEQMAFGYGEGVFGPVVENRKLEDIRHSLRNPNCEGPEIVYTIAMDVGRLSDRKDLVERNLLYGAVLYAKGRLGEEPIRSQGHIHALSGSCGMSTPEVYEIWSGEAYIYMQESAQDAPGRCFAVLGKPGDVIVVPPGWAHATISADAEKPLAFGAWCVRDFGFDYKDVRAHKGLAYYPLCQEDGTLNWVKNTAYLDSELVIKTPRAYAELEIKSGMSIYDQYLENPERFMYVVNPRLRKEIWEKFIP
ncbi:MAG: glucose-6-phosphate isomerase [Vallitaleaceae bacterium]|nr:glucose-6-phosphate isomerase [Vallitaleaceae bacterium]